MPERSALLLSGDETLIGLVDSLLPNTELVVVSCPAQKATSLSAPWLLIAPWSVKSCCVERLKSWRTRLDQPQVVFLSYPATPEILLTLARICPEIASCLEPLPTIIPHRSSLSPALQAWADRDRIFATSDDDPQVVQAFVRLAVDRDHDGLTVTQAATALRISDRTLRRRSARSIGYAPEIVIDLARVVSVAAHLRNRNDPLSAIAKKHSFPHASSMSRCFQRFLGVRPGVYRKRPGVRLVAGNDIGLSKNSNGQRNPRAVDRLCKLGPTRLEIEPNRVTLGPTQLLREKA